MTATYDTGTDVGKVRLYIQDTDVSPESDAIFTDEEIQVFLTEEGSVKSAAALGLETIASDKARLSMMLKSLNYGEDTRGASRELLERAQRLRETETAAFGWAEQSLTDQNVIDAVINRALRGQ